MLLAYTGLQRNPASPSMALVCVPDAYYDGAPGSSPHTILSLHGESLIDSSSDPKTLVNTSVTISTAQQKFGASALYFNGSARLTTSQITDFIFGTSDFTLEAQVYPLATGAQRIIVRSASGGVYPFSLAISSGAKFAFFCCNGVSAVMQLLSTTTVTTGRWWHLFAVRRGNAFFLFVDGAPEASMTNTLTLTENGVNVSVGAYNGGAEAFNGYIDDLRVTRGVARALPTIDVPTAAFGDSVLTDPHFASVAVLLHGESLVDSSGTPKTLTAYNGAAVSTAQKQFGASSLASTTTNQSRIETDHTGCRLTGDFTVECFLRMNTVLSGKFFISSRWAGAGTRQVYIYCSADGELKAAILGATISSTKTVVVDVWYHVAVVRASGKAFMFVDGQLTGVVASANDQTFDTGWAVGCADVATIGASNASCFIDEFRVTQGVARYTANFTPPVMTFCDSSAGSAAPPVAAPAPPPMPQPPVPQPITFAASSVATLSGLVGTPIGSTTLATITCADAAMTVSLSETVPGLTFDYTANVLTVSGTPTAPGGAHRVVVSYVASDGSYSIRGSTEHTINIADAAVPFVVGSCASASGRVGQPIDVVLCEPTIAANVPGVTISPDRSFPPGLLSWVWTPGASSAGVLRFAGTPEVGAIFSGTLTVTYRTAGWPQEVLGTSTHQISISAAYVAPTPAPAPAPAPPAPSPSAPPPPPPAPTPGPGPDPFLSSVKVLHRFESITTGDLLGTPFYSFPATIGPAFIGDVALTIGAVGSGALLSTPDGIGAYVDGLDGADGALTVECMVDIDAACWAAMTAPGADQRICPIVGYREAALFGRAVWMLGLVRSGGIVFPVFWRRVTTGATGSYVVAMGSLTWRPGRFVHIAFNSLVSGSLATTAAWFDGAVAAGGNVSIASLLASPSGFLQVGGDCPLIEWVVNTGRSSSVVPLSGVVDELRITAPGRYDSYTAPPIALPAMARVIPWPNY